MLTTCKSSLLKNSIIRKDFLLLAQKLFNTANQTIQTLLRYRSESLPTMQIIPVHNDEKAIDDEELSSSSHHNGSEGKISN